MYLIDTNIFIWLTLGRMDKVSPKILDIVESEYNIIHLSSASIWEIEVKRNLEKLDCPEGILDIFDDFCFEKLDINFNDAHLAANLDKHHNDPFDRIIISQAINNNLKILTSDKIFKKYKVKTIY
jgi:PIN domain nuclease of toxin-antitoxin system